jgi:tryptophan synthase alpha chain
MKNKIEQLFKEKKNNILSIYFTSGFPKLNDTATVIEELGKAGVDMIEVGIPFSDPLADGPVIQHSSEVALKNGMSLKLLFDQLKNLPTANRPLPTTLLMGYLNPVLQFGIENFCKKAQDCGISGVIIPDLPLQEYLDDYKSIFEKYGLLNIFLITPQTSEERIRLIDQHSKGFIYMVSSSSTTGVKNGIDNTQEKYFMRIKNMKLNNPLMVGFGISDKTSFAKACEFANGAIIGSGFIKAIEKNNDLKSNIANYITSIR